MSSDLNISSFDDMGFSDELLRGIYAYGFEYPTLIQKQTINPLFNRRNVIAQGHPGSGKTAAFVIGILKKLDINKKSCQAIVLCPTRELVLQTYDVFHNIAEYLHINIATCIGGTPVRECINNILKSQIVIGTIGRIFDMINRNVIVIDTVKTLVIDEADSMCSGNSSQNILLLIKSLSEYARVALFSTLPCTALNIRSKLFNPVIVTIEQQDLIPEGIKHYYVNVNDNSYKNATLCDLLSKLNNNSTISFCSSEPDVDETVEYCRNNDIPVTGFHQSLTFSERKTVMYEFRSGSVRHLITTDIVSYGLNFFHVGVVFNVNILHNSEDYVRKVNRTGRFGRCGYIINLITNEDLSFIKDLENAYSIEIKELPIDLLDNL
ncbi:RNA helicase [Entamoeba marina]